MQTTAVGEYGAARSRLYGAGVSAENTRGNNSLLDRVRLLQVDLADGQARAAEVNANRVYEVLRTQGINADRTVASVVFGEGVRYWKGEPFEQALAYTYIAVQKAMIGDWGNARAAAEGSLFLLRDFGENERGRRLSQRELAERAARAGDRYLESYEVRDSDFALGYFLSGVASLAIGDQTGASERLAEAVALRPDLADAVEALHRGEANTILIVDYGLAPTKIATGPSGAISDYSVNTWSDQSAMRVTVDGREAGRFPIAADVNAMAADHSWRNLEDVRVAKAIIGQGLVATGAVVAATADDDQAQLVGLGLILAGLATSATASADTRHNELLPQRVYVAAVGVTEPDSTVRIEAGGRESASMTLLGVDPPSGERFQLRYVRMNAPGAMARWASSKQVYYRSDSYDGALASLDSGASSGGAPSGGEALGDLPYILGGQDVSTPTHEALARYQAAGYLRGYTLNDLTNLYREERITLTTEEQGGAAARHILEGGSSLVAPLAGTAGFARLFQTPHPVYRARSELVRRVAREQRALLEPYGSP
ncbi:MAG: hypothetical protein KDA31_10190 [Phycisphaerales bacterium]|nr:hypothetical protein [Phycisphaerales bacterium]